MSEKKKFTLYAGSVALCVCTAVLLHYVSVADPYLESACRLLRPFIYIGLYVVWAISFRKRIIQKEIRRCLTAIAAMMIFWMFIRLCKVEDMLLFTNFDLNYISQETGYADCSHLIRSFKEKYGVSPHQYRRQHSSPRQNH